ncbi:hypothetical protein BVY02_01495 [bacterium J17]|nr:hypothetical protein BVY02_01495 [bacterium J17]
MFLALMLISLFGVFYAYFGYPMLLLLIAPFKKGPQPRSAIDMENIPKISLIITARNEEAVIGDKLNNSLSLRYPIPVQIIVASDASDDSTDYIVGQYREKGVQLVRSETRGGKEYAQGKAMRESAGDVIVFTDAKVRLAPDALEKFACYFYDEKVGAVSSLDQVEPNSAGESSGEGVYVAYEMGIRRMESRIATLVGLSGSCFAVRRELCEPWCDDLPSDFALLLRAVQGGYRGVHADDVVHYYQTVSSSKKEFGRKVRTVLRGISTVFARAEALNPAKYGVFSLLLISHKLTRWLVPWFVVLGLLVLPILLIESFVYFPLLVGLVVFCLIGLVGPWVDGFRDSTLCKICNFFIISNAGVFIAWLHFFSGKRRISWEPSEKGVFNS